MAPRETEKEPASMTIESQKYEESPQPEQDPILEIRNATVEFSMTRGTSKVLNDVSIDIAEEEILAVVGESGSGKSMFAEALLDAVVDPGVLTGDIIYNGGDDPVNVLELSKQKLRKFRWEEIAMVSQGALDSFNPVIKVKKHFIETLEEHNSNVDEGMERANRILNDLHLSPNRVLNAYPHELSGGMKQRVLIALSLILEPQVLVMDEPTAALDLLMQRSILSLIEEIKNEYKLTVVFITHDLPLISRLADRVAVMYAFQFVEIGPVEEILMSSAHPYTRSLLKSTPDLKTSVEEMEPIKGSSPDPVDIPSGCSYHPRCPLGDEFCTTEEPPFYEVSNKHTSACIYWDEADDAVPLPWGETNE